jgi:hypothetical protein
MGCTELADLGQAQDYAILAYHVIASFPTVRCESLTPKYHRSLVNHSRAATSFHQQTQVLRRVVMSLYRIGVSAAVPSAVETRVRERGEEGQAQPLMAVFDRLTKWIPGDALAIYAPGVTLLGASSARPSAWFLVVMVIATPLFTLGFAFSTGARLTRRVWVSAGLAAIAFAIWSLSVPMNGWQSIGVIASNKGAVAVGAAVIGILFGYLAEGVAKRASL